MRLALIWFGAGVSVAEIITGTYFAPLGFLRGISAILIGHAIGCVILFFAGYIGALSGKSSMEAAKYSFGITGSKMFAVLNVVQLAGWTGIMIYDGSLAASKLFFPEQKIWAIAIGFLIILWLFLDLKKLSKVNVAAMSALFMLTVILCFVISSEGKLKFMSQDGSMSFGQSVELAVAMPLSWLPLISDYTRNSRKPLRDTIISSVSYCVTSTWMYVIGMVSSIYAGESDFYVIMLKSGPGSLALAIIVLSTVTTTCLDSYSAGISFCTISSRADERKTGIAVTVIGILGAMFFRMDDMTSFLYFIGSVFSPMIAILLADFFVLKTDSSEKKIDVAKIALWAIGFVLYRFSLSFDFVLGNTIPVMACTFVLTVMLEFACRHLKKKNRFRG